jgi:hypothetical protein
MSADERHEHSTGNKTQKRRLRTIDSCEVHRVASRFGPIAIPLLALGSFSCEETTGPRSPWRALGLESDYFSQVVTTDSALYCANGVFGVYQQKPAYTGPWHSLGLDFLEDQFISYDLGVRTVLPLPQGEILAGVWNISTSDTVSIFRYDPLTGSWSPSGIGVSREIVYDLEQLESGIILSATSGGLFASDDQGHSWNFLIREQALSGTICQTASRVYAGGETIFQTPYLISSPAGTSEWADLGVAGKITFDRDGITGIFAREEPPQLFIQTSQQVFKSDNAGQSFVPILNLACGTGVFGNQTSNRLIALGDSVYLSDGATWTTHSLPGQCFGSGNVDWVGNKVIVPVLMHDGGLLYGLELP